MEAEQLREWHVVRAKRFACQRCACMQLQARMPPHLTHRLGSTAAGAWLL
jgi:hypothetical protein